MLNIGFGNVVAANRVVAIVSPNSAPVKRLKDEARDENRLIDVTHGRKTRSVLIMDSNHVILSAIQTETISQRLSTLMDGNNGPMTPSGEIPESGPSGTKGCLFILSAPSGAGKTTLCQAILPAFPGHAVFRLPYHPIAKAWRNPGN